MKLNRKSLHLLLDILNLVILILHMGDENKLKGNELFRSKKYFLALDFYRKGLKHIYREYVKVKTDDGVSTVKRIKNGVMTKITPESIELDKKQTTLAKEKEEFKEKMEEEMGQLYFNVAVTHFKLRDYERCLNYLNLSMSFSRNEKIQQRLVMVYAKLGLFKKFEEEYKKLANTTDILNKYYENTKLCDTHPLSHLKTIEINENCMEYFDRFYNIRKPLPLEFIVSLLIEGFKVLVNLDTIVHINSVISLMDDFRQKSHMKITRENFIFGDTHGEFSSTYKILYKLTDKFTNINGRNFIFNGDFVDRGADGIENFLLLLYLKILYPQNFYLNRGNHEYPDLNVYMGFYTEIRNKYFSNNSELFMLFQKVFEVLPIAHILDKEAFIVHGGICDTLIVDDFYDAPRAVKNKTLDFFLWADPGEVRGKRPSPRGITHVFGEDVTDIFLKKNNLKLIIRSHEYDVNGYRENHNKKVITIFSAPNYCRMNNNAAYLNYRNRNDYEVVVFY